MSNFAHALHGRVHAQLPAKCQHAGLRRSTRRSAVWVPCQSSKEPCYGVQTSDRGSSVAIQASRGNAGAFSLVVAATLIWQVANADKNRQQTHAALSLPPTGEAPY